MDSGTAKIELERLHRTYDLIADGFSQSRSKAWPEFKLIADQVERGDKVLDLGCGNGRFYEVIKDKEVDYTGVDFSGSLLDIAKKKYPHLRFENQDMTELELDDRFNRVVSIAAINHLPSREMRMEVFKRIYEVLRDDGKLVLVVWNLWKIKFWRFHLKAWFRSFSSQGRYGVKDLMIPFGAEKVERYYYAYTMGELRRMVRDAGFAIEEAHRSVEGRDNFFLVCRKEMKKAVSDPISIGGIIGKREFGKSPEPAYMKLKI